MRSNKLTRELERRICVSQFNIQGISLAKCQVLQRLLAKYDIYVEVIQETHVPIRVSRYSEEKYKDLTCLGIHVITFMVMCTLCHTINKYLSLEIKLFLLVSVGGGHFQPLLDSISSLETTESRGVLAFVPCHVLDSNLIIIVSTSSLNHIIYFGSDQQNRLSVNNLVLYSKLSRLNRFCWYRCI